MSLVPVTYKICSEYTSSSIAHFRAHMENANMSVDNRGLLECDNTMALGHNWLGNTVKTFYLCIYIYPSFILLPGTVDTWSIYTIHTANLHFWTLKLPVNALM